MFVSAYEVREQLRPNTTIQISQVMDSILTNKSDTNPETNPPNKPRIRNPGYKTPPGLVGHNSFPEHKSFEKPTTW
jgi:hypothetical protein